MSKVINWKEFNKAMMDGFMMGLTTGNVIIDIDKYNVVPDIEVKGEVVNVKS